MKYWGSLGAFWGGLWGLLVGAAFFWVPGVGPLLVAGPVAAWIIGDLEGGVVVGGLSVLGAALYSAGIPKAQHPEVRDRRKGRQVSTGHPRNRR